MSYAPIRRCHLIYHVYPARSNELWRANLAQLTRRWDVFDGRRIVAVATGPSTHTVDEVARELGESRHCELLESTNDPRLREVATFPLLLSRVYTTESDAVFYAHTKGNTNPGVGTGGFGREGSHEGIRRWRNAMYAHLLDDVARIKTELRDHPAVGACQATWSARAGTPYPSRLRWGNWMFCGTFFWFRADAVFTNPDWRKIPDDRYGAEAWLSGLFPMEACASVYQPFAPAKFPNPYDARLHPATVDE